MFQEEMLIRNQLTTSLQTFSEFMRNIKFLSKSTIDPDEDWKKLFVSCNPTLTSFYSKKSLP